MAFNFATFMDISILVLLALTVLLAFRLSLSLRNFKESRFEMEGLVNRLTSNIERAERAVGGLQNAARNSGAELDKIIRDARSMSDELRFMNDAGNNLANRLEKLAEKNRELVEKIEGAGGVGPASHQAQMVKEAPAKEIPATHHHGFAIHDRDAGEDIFDDDFDLEITGLQSQAERELFEALHGGSKRQRGRPQ